MRRSTITAGSGATPTAQATRITSTAITIRRPAPAQRISSAAASATSRMVIKTAGTSRRTKSDWRPQTSAGPRVESVERGRTLASFGGPLAEDALRAEDEDQDQDREDDRLRPG